METFEHEPVLLAEVLTALAPRPGGKYVDATIGGAGHAAAILKASGATGWLWGFDRDGAALEAARRRLVPYPGRFELRRSAFADLATWVPEGACDGVLFDLGVSSPQLDRPERGFSFQSDGPLDMRMDPDLPRTASDWVNTAPADELARIFREYGEEPRARRVAQWIEQARKVQPLTTTRALATLVERAAPRGASRIHPATRIFQALRIAVNDELTQLRCGLEAAVRILAPGGRLAVISFHSLEARLVKRFGAEATRDYEFDGEVDVPELRRPREPRLRWVTRRAVTPGEAELADNPRSRSAQLRVLEKPTHAS